MSRVWQLLHSWWSSHRDAAPSRIPSSRNHIVALVLDGHDRYVVSTVSAQECLDVRFAESCQEAARTATQLGAPVILIDRDWPATEWRAAVESLASLLHNPCVLLVSAVSDDYLLQELIRQGGYDILLKPLRAENAARAIKLALSYWHSAPHALLKK
jgi:AmiR/NasT family two-component response regulator